MKWKWLLVLLFMNFSTSVRAENDGSDLESLLEHYVDQVQTAAREHYVEWTDELGEFVPGTKFTGIRLHATPWDEAQLGQLKKSWFFFWKKVPKLSRPSGKHLNVVNQISEETRDYLALHELVGFRAYLWTEPKFLQLEKIILSRMENEIGEFVGQINLLHESRIGPAPFEQSKLSELYLNIWVLGALLHIESERYLSAFPYQNTHRASIKERQTPITENLAGCRIALIRIGDAEYRW